MHKGTVSLDWYVSTPTVITWLYEFFLVLRSGASLAVGFSSFWVVTNRRFVATDVSGQPIVPVFKGQAVQEDFFWAAWHLQMGPDRLSRNEMYVDR
jgi:hypothetical protein